MAVLVYKCIVSCNRHLSRNIFTHIYACTQIFVSKTHVIVKLPFFTLKINFIQTKIIQFSESTFKIKVTLAIRPILCGNCAFPQNFHTRKLGEITVFYTVTFLDFADICS